MRPAVKWIYWAIDKSPNKIPVPIFERSVTAVASVPYDNIITSSTILKNIKIAGCKSNFHNEVKKKNEDIGVSPWMNQKRNIAGGNDYQDKE